VAGRPRAAVLPDGEAQVAGDLRSDEGALVHLRLEGLEAVPSCALGRVHGGVAVAQQVAGGALGARPQAAIPMLAPRKST
jgi:hypothetical protein